MSHPTAPGHPCPDCHATVPAGAPWCSLCYADLRPKAVVATPAGSSSYDVPDDAGRAATSADASLRADEMLARLAAESSHPLGPFAGALDTAAKRLALTIGGGVVATGLIVVVMLALGALL